MNSRHLLTPVCCACLVMILVLSCVIPPTAAQETLPSTNSTDQARHVETLKSARALTVRRGQLLRLYGNAEDPEVKELGEKFAATLRQAASAFPELDPRARSGTNRFFTLDLNRHGAGLDGFRFRNDSAEPKNFAWIFAVENVDSFVSWFIVPMIDQPFQGLRGVFYEPTLFYTNAPWSNSPRYHKQVVQRINDQSFLPGREYIAWFNFNDARTSRVHVAFDLFPAKKPMETHAAAEDYFGLKGPLIHDRANPAGIR